MKEFNQQLQQQLLEKQKLITDIETKHQHDQANNEHEIRQLQKEN